MIVHFAGSRWKMTEPVHVERLQAIVKAIRDNGHQLVDNWVDRTQGQIEWHGLKRDDIRDPEGEDAYKAIIEAITKADVVIADASVRSFSVGFQVATAVHMKKPTLVLRQEYTTPPTLFAGGIEAGVIYKTYDLPSIEGTIREFLEANDVQSKDLRFNFFMDRKVYNYLKWASFKTGKTKARILRELVEQEIERRTP